MDEYLSNSSQPPLSNTPITLDNASNYTQPQKPIQIFAIIRAFTLAIFLSTFISRGVSFYNQWKEQESLNQADTSSIVQTKPGWKHHKVDKLGYSFSYPAELFVDAESEDAVFMVSKDLSTLGQNPYEWMKHIVVEMDYEKRNALKEDPLKKRYEYTNINVIEKTDQKGRIWSLALPNGDSLYYQYELTDSEILHHFEITVYPEKLKLFSHQQNPAEYLINEIISSIEFFDPIPNYIREKNNGFETITDEQNIISLGLPSGYDKLTVNSPTPIGGISINAQYETWSLLVVGIPDSNDKSYQQLKDEVIRSPEYKRNFSQAVVNFSIDGEEGVYSKEIDDLRFSRTFVVTHNGWFYSFNFNYSHSADFEPHEETVKQIMKSVDFLK